MLEHGLHGENGLFCLKKLTPLFRFFNPQHKYREICNSPSSQPYF